MRSEFKELSVVAVTGNKRVTLRKAKFGCSFSVRSHLCLFGHLKIKWVVMFLPHSNTIIIVDFK